MTSPSHNDDDDDKRDQNQAAKARAELPYLFERELTLKQNKRIYIVDEFIATERVAPIEGKFYSTFNDAHIREDAQAKCYWQLTEKYRDGSRMRQGFPVLESQTYGWLPKSVSMVALKRINYVQAPKRRCAMTAYGEKLNCERVTERPKFTGERFHLM